MKFNKFVFKNEKLVFKQKFKENNLIFIKIYYLYRNSNKI